MINLKLPLTEETVRNLNVGDRVLLTGRIYTARDKAHVYLLKKYDLNLNLEGSVLYHCGPIVRKNPYEIVSAGPTTSTRLSRYEGDVIKKFGIRAVIGKGGMDEKTLEAFREHGCVYLSATGGAASLLAQSIDKVAGVYKLEEFGIPEAIWILDVKEFPTIVTMDAKGNSLHENVKKKSKKIYDILISEK